MLLIVLGIQFVVQVLSEATLAPPQNLHVEGGLLTWTPATERTDFNYTVQYRSFEDKVWKHVPACVHTSLLSCNVTFIKGESENGCVTLRVQAERHGLISRPAEACSKHGDSCTPEVNLTARPGSLTVYLSVNPHLVDEYGDHVKHRVYYGKEGESLEKDYEESVSSVPIHGLEQGLRYCVKAQYLYFNTVIGTASCIQCAVIPESAEQPKLTEVIIAVGVVVSLAILIPVIAYILIFHRNKIKLWLQPPYDIPDHFLLQNSPSLQLPSSSSEEDCDVIIIERVSQE